MNIYIQKLWELQQYDLRLSELKRSLKMPLRDEILKLKDQIYDLISNIEMENQEIDKLKTEQRRIEFICKELKHKTKEFEEKLYSGKISNVKELEQLEKELTSMKEQEKNEENNIIELIEKIESVEKKLNNKNANLKKMKINYKKNKGKYTKILKDKKDEIRLLENKRIKVIKEIDNKYLEIYNDLKVRKNGNVLAVVSEDKCQGCNVTLPTVQISQMKSKKEIVTCDNCDRILIEEDRS